MAAQRVDVAKYKITVGSKTFTFGEKDGMVGSFVVESDLNKPDVAKIKLSNVDESLLSQCVPGKDMEIQAGYESLGTVFKGAVATRNPNYDLGDRWVLEVTAYNALYKLKEQPRSETYQQMTIQQVIQRIVGRHGLSANFGKEPPTIKWEHLHQLNQTDFAFVDYLALLSKRVFYCRDKTLYFVIREKDKSPVESLSYGTEGTTSLDSFKPDLTEANQVDSVTVASYDYLKAESIRGKANAQNSSLGDSGGGKSASGGKRNLHFVLPVYNTEQANLAAESLLDRIQMEKSNAKGVMSGDHKLKVGEIVKIKLGDSGKSDYDGNYYLTRVEHRYSQEGGMVDLVGAAGMGGYRTIFNGKRDAGKGR